MEFNEEKRRKMEEDEMKKAEFAKTWIGQRKQHYENYKEIEQFKKWSVLFK